MDHDQALTPIALQPDCFGKDPIPLLVTIPTGDLELAEAAGVLAA
jgi:hypothetical protein